MIVIRKLRTPFLLLALLVSVVIVLIERVQLSPETVVGYLPAFLTQSQGLEADGLLDIFSDEQKSTLEGLMAEKKQEASQRLSQDLEGLGVPSLQFVDLIVVFTALLVSSGLLIPPYWQAKLQGIATLIFAIGLIIFAFTKALLAVAKLVTMVTMLLSFPFGTLAYLFIYGSFDRATATAFLSVLFLLKLLLGLLFVLAHQRFLENKGLVLIILTSFVANLIVGFLLAIVPGILVSITDALAAIVIAIIAIIWAIILLIGAIIAIIKAFT